MTLSPQTLSEADRRLLAGWAADCAERVLPLFEHERSGDGRPRNAIDRSRAYARGELDTATEIRRRFADGGAWRDAASPAAAAAARAAGQASAVSHMGAHALGAAGYALKAISLAYPGDAARLAAEQTWQLGRLTPLMRRALSQLPPLGRDRSGPLGPGLLASGELGTLIRSLQSALVD